MFLVLPCTDARSVVIQTTVMSDSDCTPPPSTISISLYPPQRPLLARRPPHPCADRPPSDGNLGESVRRIDPRPSSAPRRLMALFPIQTAEAANPSDKHLRIIYRVNPPPRTRMEIHV